MKGKVTTLRPQNKITNTSNIHKLGPYLCVRSKNMDNYDTFLFADKSEKKKNKNHTPMFYGSQKKKK